MIKFRTELAILLPYELHDENVIDVPVNADTVPLPEPSPPFIIAPSLPRCHNINRLGEVCSWPIKAYILRLVCNVNDPPDRAVSELISYGK